MRSHRLTAKLSSGWTLTTYAFNSSIQTNVAGAGSNWTEPTVSCFDHLCGKRTLIVCYFLYKVGSISHAYRARNSIGDPRDLVTICPAVSRAEQHDFGDIEGLFGIARESDWN